MSFLFKNVTLTSPLIYFIWNSFSTKFALIYFALIYNTLILWSVNFL